MILKDVFNILNAYCNIGITLCSNQKDVCAQQGLDGGIQTEVVYCLK